MVQRYAGGNQVFNNNSTIFFEKADGTLLPFVSMSSSDVLTIINGSSAESLLPSVTATYDIGSSSFKYRDFYLSRNALIGGTLGVTGSTTIADLTATSGVFSTTLGVTGLSTLAALTQVGTSNINASGSGVSTIGTGGTGAVAIGNTTGKTAITGDLTTTSGNVVVATLGKGFQLKEGSNAKAGTSTLSSGTVTVSTTAVTANSRILLSRQSVGASSGIGSLSVGTVTAGTSFVINSLAAAGTVLVTDLSVVYWAIIEPSP